MSVTRPYGKVGATTGTAEEEGGIRSDTEMWRLESVRAVGVEHLQDRAVWDPALRDSPQYGFAVAVGSEPP